MAKVINPNRWPFELPSGHIVPAFGELDTTNEVIRQSDNGRVLAGLTASGQLSCEMDQDPELKEATASFEAPGSGSFQETPVEVRLIPQEPPALDAPPTEPTAPVEVPPEPNAPPVEDQSVAPEPSPVAVDPVPAEPTSDPATAPVTKDPKSKS